MEYRNRKRDDWGLPAGLVVSVVRSGHQYDRGYSIEFLNAAGEVVTSDMEDLRVVERSGSV